MNAASSFFQRLRDQNAASHEAALAHPVVLGIGDGSLPEADFRHYVEQDYQFLLRYARVLARAVASSPDLPTTTRLAALLHATLDVEIDALIDLYASFDGDRERLDTVTPTSACQAYTDHLLAASAEGNLLVTLAAILPCQWGYREIGRSLVKRGVPDDERYARWIGEYASDAYGALVDWLVARFDALADDESYAARERAAAAFALSAAHELAFWQMVRDPSWHPGCVTEGERMF